MSRRIQWKICQKFTTSKNCQRAFFPVSFNIIDRYHLEDPFLTEKINCAKYQKGSFHGGRNTIELVTYKNKVLIPQKLQKYVVNWYHTYILHPGLDITEAIICRHLYWSGIREAVLKEVTNCGVSNVQNSQQNNTVNYLLS